MKSIQARREELKNKKKVDNSTASRRCQYPEHDKIRPGVDRLMTTRGNFTGAHKICNVCRAHKEKLRYAEKQRERFTQKWGNYSWIMNNMNVLINSPCRTDSRLVAEAKVYHDYQVKDITAIAYTKTVDTDTGTICPIQPMFIAIYPQEYVEYVFFTHANNTDNLCQFLLFFVAGVHKIRIVVFGTEKELSNIELDSLHYAALAAERYGFILDFVDTELDNESI